MANDNLNTGFFFHSAKMAKRRYIKMTLKKLCEKDRWNSVSDCKIG